MVLECLARFRLVKKEDADEAPMALGKQHSSPLPAHHQHRTLNIQSHQPWGKPPFAIWQRCKGMQSHFHRGKREKEIRSHPHEWKLILLHVWILQCSPVSEVQSILTWLFKDPERISAFLVQWWNQENYSRFALVQVEVGISSVYYTVTFLPLLKNTFRAP